MEYAQNNLLKSKVEKKYPDNILDKFFQFILLIDFSQRLSYHKYLKDPKISPKKFILKIVQHYILMLFLFFMALPIFGLLLFCFVSAFAYIRFCVYVAKLANWAGEKPSNCVALSLITLHLYSLYFALTCNKHTEHITT